MITKNSISWNTGFQNDGYLYFAQRIVEMLEYLTVDIFRAPLLNTHRLADEYLRIFHDGTRDFHKEEVYHEFIYSFENDIVLQSKIGQDRITQIVKRLNQYPERRCETIEFLQRSVFSDYLKWSIEYIKDIVSQTREKKKTERAIRCFIPELLRYGYSRDEIYHSARRMLEDDIIPSKALENFLGFYDCKKKQYDVYLNISVKLLEFKDILSKRLHVIFNDDGNFKKYETRTGFCPVVLKQIEALDASAAANQAFKCIEFFTIYYQCFGDYSGTFISNSVMVISTEGNERRIYVNRGKYKTIEESDTPKTGEYTEAIITQLITSARCSIPQIDKIMRLHNRAIANNGLENGFLNFWSILEVICVKDPKSSKIQQVVTITVPILQLEYLTTYFQDMNDNLKNILSDSEYRELISSIEDGESETEKVASFILLSKYKEKLDDFVDCLVNYPVLRSRMLNLNSDCDKWDKLYNLTKRYAQRVSWHIYRMYRARNDIVHSGKVPHDLKDLGEHLHAYVDCLINTIIIRLSMHSLCSISNALVDIELDHENLSAYMSRNAPIEYEGIRKIISRISSWSTEI